MVEVGARLPTKRFIAVPPEVLSRRVIDLFVFQGKGEQVEENEFVGKLHVDGIDAASRDTARLMVEFNLDRNGVLSLSASDEKSRLLVYTLGKRTWPMQMSFNSC